MINLKISFIIVLFLHFSLCVAQVDSLSYYYNSKNYSKALVFGLKLETEIKDDVRNLLVIKTNNAVMYSLIGEFKMSSKKFEEALLISQSVTEITDKEVAIIKKQAARNLLNLRELQNGKKLINESLIYFKANKKNNPGDYADALKTLGDINKKEGNIDEAILLITESSKIFKELFGENEYYSNALHSIGNCYFLKEDYSNAELYYEKSIKIQKTLNLNQSDYALSLASLSDIYIMKMQYKKAEDLLLAAMEILIVENPHIPVQISLLNKLSYLYLNAEKFDDAEYVLNLCLDLNQELYGTNHYDVLANKTNLAFVFFKQKNFIKAKKNYLEILNIFESVEIYNKTDIITPINNLGLVYTELKDYENAEKQFLRALKLMQTLNFSKRSKLLGVTENITILYLKMEKHSFLNKNFKTLLNLNQGQILEFNQFFIESDWSNYLRKNIKSIYFPFSFLHNNPNQHSNLNIAAYENELLLKNLSLRNQQRIKNTIEKSDDNSLKEKYKKFIANKHYLTKLEEMPSSEFPVNYDQLKADTETLEKEITRLSSDFAESKKALSLDFKQIQQKLKPNEVIVDIVSFNYYNKKWTDSIMYGAFVIKKESKYPKYISLFEQKQLKSLLENNSKNSDSTRINKQYSSKAISDLFLKPLETELKNGKTIFIVPSGLAHQINFKALPFNEKQTLGEQFNVVLMGASSSIIDYKTTAFQNNKELEFILYGGIDYNKIGKETNDEVVENNFNELATRSGILTYNYLPGTNTEIEKINTEVQKHDFKSVLKTDKQATEESIKQLEGKQNPYVLHIATHGFFFEDLKRSPTEEGTIINEYTKQNTYSGSNDPMMRSGLILAGANKYWGKTNEKLSTEDGILTAKEIANLDLSNCQLVVLSACETGLGQINGSEGVFGLQRAFKMAGVKNIIMSLWKVPDAQTSELFTIFYAECFKGQSIQMAFQTAQSQMKAKYAPYYWAGFVLLE